MKKTVGYVLSIMVLAGLTGIGLNGCGSSNGSSNNNVTHYSCSGNSCVIDPNGGYTTPDCGNSCAVPPSPLNPAGVYSINYSPATSSANCTFTDTTKGSSYPTATTITTSSDTITLSTASAAFTTNVTWVQDNKSYTITGHCYTAYCSLDAAVTLTKDCSSTGMPSCTATWPIDENVTTTTTQMNGTATWSTFSANGTLSNGDTFIANCNLVTNPLTLTGTKQ